MFSERMLVSLQVDLWPTLVELAGIAVPPTCPPLPQALKTPGKYTRNPL